MGVCRAAARCELVTGEPYSVARMAGAALPMFLSGQPVTTARTLGVPDRFTGVSAYSVCLAGAAELDRAIGDAAGASGAMGSMPIHARSGVLRRVSSAIEERSEEFALTLVTEAGKPRRDAEAEVARAAETFRVASEECARGGGGEYLRLDASPRAERCRAVTRRVPVGPLGFITPFNFPLNLVAHKVAPAIAAGCPWVLKPSEKAPVSALLLGRILAEQGLPRGSWSILPAMVEDARALVSDDRIRLLSFTGSAPVGWALKQSCGRKKISLELGGDGTAIVEPDADLGGAVARLLVGMFSNSGQSCISVQRVLAHRSVYHELKGALVAGVSGLASGDPSDPGTVVGPLITPEAAERVERWVRSAVSAGATLLCGGERSGSVVAPTLLENVAEGSELRCDEVFGPVAYLEAYEDFEEALARVNAGRFGLQCGVFTRDLGRALRAWEALEVGAVVVNDVPTFRTESMPYGGVKESGLGREGVRWAIEEFTEPRLLVINLGGPA